MFHDTIFYNLHYGNLRKTKDDVYAATRMADLHDSIEQWPQGYETQVKKIHVLFALELITIKGFSVFITSDVIMSWHTN